MATPNTLADPTDYGNVPGQGPLRPGGQPASISGKKDLPSTRSDLSMNQQAAVEMERDLWGGTQSVRAQTVRYLPKAPGEETDAYRARLDRSVFFNAFRRTVEGFTGLIFSKDPVLGDDVPVEIVDHWENIDLEGTHGDVFLWELENDAISVGHAAIFVEFPETEGTQGNEEEVAQEVRPYWIPIRKEDMMSWRTEIIGGVRTLIQLVLRETNWVPVGEFGEVMRTRYRVLYRDPDGTVGFRVLVVGKDNSVTQESEGVYENQTEIPVAEIKTSGSVSMFVSDPPLLDLSFLNVAHYQQWSDYAWAIHMTNVPFIFGAGITKAKNEDGTPAGPLVVGVNTAVLESDPNAKMGYVSHDGAALDASKASLDDLKSDMGTLGLAMLAPQKRAAETAEAKRLDKSTSDSALAVTARALQDGVENALQFHANYLKRPGQGDLKGGSITINRDFEGMTLNEKVMVAFGALVNAGFPPREALKGLQRSGWIEAEADLDALEVEWLMGIAAKGQAPEMG